MSESINIMLGNLQSLFNSAEQILDNYQGDKKLKFPDFLQLISNQLNWSEKQVRNHDHILRYFLHHHNDYYIAVGPNGGIGKGKKKVNARKAEVESIKKNLESLISNSVDDEGNE